jgi:peroxiredoxin Q/BCP
LCAAAALFACGGAQHAQATPHHLLPVGSTVPALARVDHHGQVVDLQAQVPTLVYFYPRDGTPGCTKEACAIRDAWQSYQLSGLRVIGVSADSEQQHRAFANQYGLPFSLVADPTHAWSDAFGVGTLNGKDARVSFLIDASGHIVKVYENVDPGVHATEVLQDAKGLGLAAPVVGD